MTNADKCAAILQGKRIMHAAERLGSECLLCGLIVFPSPSGELTSTGWKKASDVRSWFVALNPESKRWYALCTKL
jgi:hypothetical protein